ncbi:glycoside hydrolase family 3 N-terminal domain-containing protein [Desertivirga xinjiangensis]|uniref:glycoside hydrolase family 3 N-terminal domain-containing protein n=1 Tax=Desertivirga xinjiangensis TaxID=539206 RepID=UPI00210CA3B5|nr:glycoside hydrolase family 3 N-terminal domain-containing protein [Pedobacter xinjiangensis]
MKRLFTLLMCLSCYCSLNAQNEQRIQNLISRMTLEEKAGQMTQISIELLLKAKDGVPIEPHQLDSEKLKECIGKYKVGSILNVGGNAQTRENWQSLITQIQNIALKQRLKIPVLYGIDGIHGNNYTSAAVLFPQPITQAASFNPDIAKRIGQISAYETRASFIPWTFSPVLDLGRQPLWPRIWETFGEDPHLVSEMGKATVLGFQGEGQADKYHVMACLKHYMGYSMPLSGHDRTPAWIPERELREYFLPQFAEAVKTGAMTVMVNSGEINGVPVHANKHILTDILKGELGFQGFAVSDWQDIEYLWQRHKVARDNKEAIALAINAGIDMSMVPLNYTFTTDLIQLVKEGKIPMSRIDDAVSRILKVKMLAGLFEEPTGKASDYPQFSGEAHHRANYETAAECITLLKNLNSTLPLKNLKRILVTGPAASSMRALNGGWSRNWQGTNSDTTESSKNTILEAMRDTFGASNIDYAPGADFNGNTNFPEALNKAANADAIVVCLGENSYTETPGNFDDLTLPAAQLDLARTLAKARKPMILVLTEGRPRVVSSIEPLFSAVIQAYLPGNEGGNAIADVIAGKINPSGKLPYTYPRYGNSLHNYYYKYTESKDLDPTAGYNPQWEFGFGLSYTTFSYSNLRLNTDKLSEKGTITVSVDVSNTGKIAGKESVLLFVSDLVASVTPEAKRLRAFKKIEIQSGQTQTVKFTLSGSDLSFINTSLQRITEPGDFIISIGGLKQTFTYHL